MTPAQMAALHGRAFTQEKPWSAASFEEVLANPFTRLLSRAHGLAIVRTIAGQSELLTVAVDPDHQRQGIAQGILTEWLESLCGVADSAFLEVAADNAGAVALYRGFGFRQTGVRTGYYARKTGEKADALLMSLAIAHR